MPTIELRTEIKANKEIVFGWNDKWSVQEFQARTSLCGLKRWYFDNRFFRLSFAFRVFRSISGQNLLQKLYDWTARKAQFDCKRLCGNRQMETNINLIIVRMATPCIVNCFWFSYRKILAYLLSSFYGGKSSRIYTQRNHTQNRCHSLRNSLGIEKSEFKNIWFLTSKTLNSHSNTKWKSHRNFQQVAESELSKFAELKSEIKIINRKWKGWIKSRLKY